MTDRRRPQMSSVPPGDNPFADLQPPIVKVKADKEVPEKFKPEKEHKIEKFEKEKPEKLEKHEKEKPEKEKPEKEHKLEKPEKEKHEKESKHEKLEKNEKQEIKEHKNEKFEVKELKVEKVEKLEIEVKDVREIPGKELVEGPQVGGGEVVNPALDPQTLLQHAQSLEDTGRQLRHFIERSMRPDLSTGALNDEEDLQQDEG
jgi:hypothetical protein